MQQAELTPILTFIYLRQGPPHTLQQYVTNLTFVSFLLINKNDCCMQHFPIPDVQE